MYQVTFIRYGQLRTINTPNAATAGALRALLPVSRMWLFVAKAEPVLLR